MTGFVLDDFLPYQLAVLASRTSREFSTIYRERYGIGVAEWRVVAHLSQTDEPVSVREICAQVQLEKSKVSRAASRLQARGFLHKVTNEQDRRLVELSLTDKGRAMIDDLAPVAREFHAELLKRAGDLGEPFQQGIDRLLEQAPEA